MSSDGRLSEVGQERVRELGQDRARRRNAEFSKLRYYASRTFALCALGGALGLVLTFLFALSAAVGFWPNYSLFDLWKPLARNVVLNIIWLYGFGKLAEMADNPEVSSRG